MRIKLKLFAMLEQLLPAGSQNHTVELEVPDGATVRRVIEQMRIPPQLAHLVLIEGTHLSPEEIERRPLHDGEIVSIFPPIAGG